MDFISVCERVSNKDLKKFFDQWVFTGTENLQLDYKWKLKVQNDGKCLIIFDLSQKQEQYYPFDFKLEVMFEYDDNKSFSRIYNVNSKEQSIEILLDKIPNQLILDPNNWLLANIKDRNSYEN